MTPTPPPVMMPPPAGACSAVVVSGSVPVRKRRLEGIPQAFLYVVEADGERLAWIEIEGKGEMQRFVPAVL